MIEVLKNRKILVSLAVIVFIGGFLRLVSLSEVPFVADEFLDVNATYGHFQTGQWQAWDFNHGEPSVRDNKASDERAWMYRIQASFLYNYLEPTESTVRLASALWGTVTTLLIFFVAYSFTRNVWIALIAAFLWAVSPAAIEMNRKIRMYSMFAPIFLLLSWAVYGLLERGKSLGKGWIAELFSLNYWYLLPIAILLPLAYHLHPLTGNVLFVLYVYLAIRAIQSIEKGQAVSRYLLYVVLLILALVGIKVIVPDLFAWFAATLAFFKSNTGYMHHVLAHYWHPWIGLTLLGLGTYYLLKKSEDRIAGLWIVATFFTILFAAMFMWQRNVGVQYIFFAQPFGLMITAAGIYYLANFLKQNIKGKHTFCVALFIAAVFVPAYGYYFQENNTYGITSRSEQPNYRKAFDYIKRNYTEGDVMITRNFRNYYYSGLGVQVFDFGTERSEDAIVAEGKVKKVTEKQVRDIVSANPSGWVLYSDNDEQFISKEARAYFDENFEKIIDSPLIRGKITVYRW